MVTNTYKAAKVRASMIISWTLFVLSTLSKPYDQTKTVIEYGDLVKEARPPLSSTGDSQSFGVKLFASL